MLMVYWQPSWKHQKWQREIRTKNPIAVWGKNLTLIFSLQFVCLFFLTPEITSIGLKAVQFIH